MEFRVLSGQHMTSFYVEQSSGNSGVGAFYRGKQVKITTDGERAIIYKRKEKHPKIKNKYTYSYFLLGDGKITSCDGANSNQWSFQNIDGWEYPPALDNEVITNLQMKTIMDWDAINNPSWTTFPFYDRYGSDLRVLDPSSFPDLFCANMEVGTNLSNTIPSQEYKAQFFGLPSSLNNINMREVPEYSILNAFYGNRYDGFFPFNNIDTIMEMVFKSTLLWNSDGSLTDYGRQFAGYEMLTAYDLYNMLDSSPYSAIGSSKQLHGFNSQMGQNIFDPNSMNITYSYISHDGIEGIGKRLGSTYKNDILPNLCEEYMFVGIYVTEDYEQGKKYVEDGTVPDDATKNDDVSPKTDEDKTHNEDGKDNTKKDDQKLHDPEHTALNSGSTTYYYMNATALNSFIKWFWNDTGDLESILNNYISNMYGDLKECISGVYHFPCPLSALCSTTGNKEIVIGRYQTGLTADFLQNPPKNKLLGSVNLNDDEWKITNSFLDYDGYTTIAMYLPYLGVVDLPTKTVQKTKLSVYYAVDVPSMQLKYTIKSNGLIVHEQVVQFGDDVPISLSSGLQNVTNTVSAVTGMASDVALLGTMGGGKKAIASTLVHTVADAHTTTDGITVKGNSSGVMGKWGSLKCALIVTKPISKRPSNYAKIKGNLICDTYKLSSLTGLTICENPRITFTNAKPTEKEIEEIYSYLEKGVIL